MANDNKVFSVNKHARQAEGHPCVSTVNAILTSRAFFTPCNQSLPGLSRSIVAAAVCHETLDGCGSLSLCNHCIVECPYTCVFLFCCPACVSFVLWSVAGRGGGGGGAMVGPDRHIEKIESGKPTSFSDAAASM